MSPPAHQPAAGGASRTDATQAAAAAPGAGPFVINLCSSTTPMALTQPQLAELKRFTFFVSRRLEDRRERFRLHMGYFETLQDAEDWLGVVREIYPGAWAGETPGKKLRERAAASAPAAPSAIAPQVAAPLVRAPMPAPARAAAPAALPPLGLVPTLHAAPVAPPRPAPAPAPRAAAVTRPAPAAPPLAKPAPANARAPQLARAQVARTQARTPAKAPAARPPVAKPAVAKPAAAKPSAARPGVAPAPVRPAAAAPPQSPPRPASNVRQAPAPLDDTGHTRQMPAPPIARAAPSRPDSLSDSQVLRILEERRADGGRAEVSDTGISLLKPDDTGTRRALKDAITQNQPVAFAVQLNWSVQPIDLRTVPPLAIFSAYTLYTVEGSREGRHWYGLRLGFFSDAISAKQVAYYVRSEFASVAVVPVSPQERDRASSAQKGGELERKMLPVQDRLPTTATSEFKLFDATTEARMLAAEKAISPPPPPPPSAALEATARGPTPKRGAKRQLGKVNARDKRSPKTLEETLEILGAGDLEIDKGRGELLNDTGVRHLKVSIQRETPFTKLLDKLSDRLNRG